ncbi:MAG: Lipopolysaccharide biosynthesis protein RffA [Candidatus Moranbacteria bacterium GW2011_GWE2_35_2-]|nr:MAG: Lipopolysaccharide biosynthesis protein RffA [Candidatus Moranbacteria bacterium GW2011_GWE2_35_2-]KKQ22868.1 MAG: Lipopolysaccharide biosynthesis protein RffA [Candidatus Moranbacteria bacterium GW2011_GWF2_37_11]KKQ29226.1 MAG: Lipopolysaccharide biosynthesis protein RffA [Candidatus Moranbacteria bacterium GW2011_GWD1_37_17]KKQ30901.1 MAG: Lipopolysaccharide biosynthesis protein RffA [Candidatus Moranbacteria bacterium GW2011_GWE1_37_24]KKQ46971.1 MAG: Lipopolysaccharide biosynthesis
MKILFNIPAYAGNELRYISEVFKNRKLSGDGEFTKKCSLLMEEKFNAKKVLLTTSGTHALDMAALLLNLKPGDEVIVPSYTFTSTANAFVLQGAIPIFVDIREDTLNIDENLIEEKITNKTKAIFVVHYAGVACEMDTIIKIAEKYKLYVVEDAAQGVNAKYKNKYLGTIGDLGIYSFHETKNYSCGEGGALVINNKKFIERAEIIREKGTNRSKFFRGEVNKYGWVDLGSSYLPSEIIAATLYAQLEKMDRIQKKRKSIFEYYYKKLRSLEEKKLLRLPSVPESCNQNYHMFYIVLPTEKRRNDLMRFLKTNNILAVFHYLPLHSSKMGRKFGYKKNDLKNTESLSSRILRLPFYYDLSKNEIDYVIKNIKTFIEK